MRALLAIDQKPSYMEKEKCRAVILLNGFKITL